MMRIFNFAFLTLLSLGVALAKPSNITMVPKGKSKADKESHDPVPKGPGILAGGPLIGPVDNNQKPPDTAVVVGTEVEEGPTFGTGPITPMSLSMSMVTDPGFGEWSTLDDTTDYSMLMTTDLEFEDWAVFEVPADSMSTSMSMVAEPEFGEWDVFEVPTGSMSMNTIFSITLSMPISPSSSGGVTANSKAGKATLSQPSTSPVSVNGKPGKPTQGNVGKASKDPINTISADAGDSNESNANIGTTDDNTDRTWTQSPLMTSSSPRTIYVASISTLVLFSCVFANLV